MSKAHADILSRLEAAFPTASWFVQIDSGFHVPPQGDKPVGGWHCIVRGRADMTKGKVIRAIGHQSPEAAITAAIEEAGR